MPTYSGGVNRQRILTRKLTYAGLFLAIALILPFITGQIPEIGAMLSPMHIPVLLCGFLCGWPWGLMVGFIAPLLRGFLFGMPILIPTGTAMAFEMATYGAVSGILYKILPNRKWMVYPVLVIAMICGRIVWGIAESVIAGITHTDFPMDAFIAGAVTKAIPGIILHIALIPLLVMSMERAGLSLNRQ